MLFLKLQLVHIFYFSILLSKCFCPPVLPDEENSENKKDESDPLNSLEYHRYLREVVTLLETDDNFKKMIENASPDDIKSGKIATHLDLVNHSIRTQLDEIKRREIERQSVLLSRKAKLTQMKKGRDNIEELLPKHLDHNNPSTFEKSDLERLIREASNQLEEIDKQRKAEFKEHELKKEYERKSKLQSLDDESRKKAEAEYQRISDSRKNHPKINHPGSQDQLEEVWEKEDHLDGKFDPKTFFALHDTDGNGFLNPYEIEALFQIELDKVFNTSDPNYDPVEREEEMNRMREHVMKEVDTDKDGNISLDEFINATGNRNDEEWKSVEDEPQFNEKEFEEFSKSQESQSTTLSISRSNE